MKINKIVAQVFYPGVNFQWMMLIVRLRINYGTA